MSVAAIIAEYNPFHSGHAYQIKKTRELGYDNIIAVMSSDTVQRGDIAICDPGFRAREAVKNGVDLVIELPTPYSCSSAHDFASAGVHIVKSLGVANALSFGSETGDAGLLCRCADMAGSLEPAKIKELCSSGLTYPQAVSRLMGDLGSILAGANDTLAIEYILALKGTGIKPVAIKRTAAHDSPEACGGYLSASAIRQMLAGDARDKAVQFLSDLPDEDDISLIQRVEKAILFKLISSSEAEIRSAPYTSDGVAERIMRYAHRSCSLSELYDKVKSRNITHARVRRAVLMCALGVKADMLRADPPYARVLAASAEGIKLLRECKRRSVIPISSSLARLSRISEQAAICAQITEKAAWLRRAASAGGLAGHLPEASRKFSVT